MSAVWRGKVAVVGGCVCRVPGFAQIADHLTHNSPFLPFFGEVVCTLGGTLPYESHSCRRCVDSMLLMPPRPPNQPGGRYHRARDRSSSAQRWPGSKLMPRGHSANSERSTRPCAGLTSSDATRQHRVSNSPRLPWIAVQQCACNFPVSLSSIEIEVSHFHRFWALLNADSGELHAPFVWCAPSGPSGVGGWMSCASGQSSVGFRPLWGGRLVWVWVWACGRGVRGLTPFCARTLAPCLAR